MMYSSESGVDTDHDTRSQECKLVAVIPNKVQYNLKEKVALIFNNNLSEKGSYHAEFKGRKRSKMDVKTIKVNKCTLIVEAPIYHPVEDVKINVRHRTNEGSKVIGTIPFKFISRDKILADILRDYMGDPVTFMCESLGISPSDISALDDALAVTFKRNMPKGFNLLGVHNDSIGKEPCNSLHPTLLHFAAAFGLLRLTQDCLLQCPGVCEASKMKNSRGKRPNEIAMDGGFEDLADEILRFQAQQEEDIYESMENKDDESSEYLQMAPGYINVQLWQQPYGEMDFNDTHDHQGEFYEDMTKKQEADDNTDHGYVDAVRSDVQSGDDLYMDMNKSSDDTGDDVGHYVDVKREEKEDLYENYDGNQELYETMEGDTGLGDDQNEEYPNEYVEDPSHPTYDTPSNLPVSRYPEARSASVSGRRPIKYAKDLPLEAAFPPVPPRLTGPDATSPRERLPSTGSKISNLSNASGTSTSTTGSGHDGDVEDVEGEENSFMTREELIRQIENKQKEGKRKDRPQVTTKTNRYAPTKPQDSSYADGPLPPVPPADYRHLKSPPPVPSRGQPPQSPRGPRHERSKTAPVNPRDVELAQNKPNRNTSQSAKKQGARQSQAGYNRAPAAFTDQRRNSSEAASGGRPPAPSPVGDRPPAPVPKEPVKESRMRMGVVPTPMVLAMEKQEECSPKPRRAPPRPAPRKAR